MLLKEFNSTINPSLSSVIHRVISQNILRTVTKIYLPTLKHTEQKTKTNLWCSWFRTLKDESPGQGREGTTQFRSVSSLTLVGPESPSQGPRKVRSHSFGIIFVVWVLLNLKGGREGKGRGRGTTQKYCEVTRRRTPVRGGGSTRSENTGTSINSLSLSPREPFVAPGSSQDPTRRFTETGPNTFLENRFVVR